MGLEVATYISGLVSTNPVGATDPKSQGDDHIRLLKSTIKASFPAVAGAVSADHTELSLMDGITGFTGTGATLVKSASPTFTGTPVVPDAWLTFAKMQNADAVSVLGRSANSSGVMDEIAAGANDRILSRTSNALGFTQLTAGMFPSTVVPDAALSANVPLLNVSNTFSTGSNTALVLNGNATTNYALLQLNQGAAAKGAIGVSGTGGAALITGGTQSAVQMYGTVALEFSGSGGAAVGFKIDSSNNFDFKAGTVTNTGASSQQVGFNGIPNVGATSSDYTFGNVLALAEANWSAHYNGSGGNTFTIPANGTHAWPVGTCLHIANIGSGNLTIAITTDTMKLAGTSSTGPRTLAANGRATAEKVGETTWLIYGVGLN